MDGDRHMNIRPAGSFELLMSRGWEVIGQEFIARDRQVDDCGRGEIKTVIFRQDAKK